jgi:hypothetical protein
MTFLHTKVRNYKPYIICGGFMFFISLLLCGALTTYNNVFAETIDYNVNIEPSLVVTIPSNTVELNINPVTTQFNSADLSVTVGTNNATGYTLTMSSDSTELSKAGSTDTIPTLETLAGGYPETDFTVNHWGYKLSTATNYLPFATSNELDVTDAPTNSKTSIVNFAAKADLSKPAGTYKLAIDFAAVANPLPTPTMQNLDPSLCVTGAPITVVDSRDNQEYKVQRLADGNCWLLDNLALDLTDSTTMAALTPSNTNADANSLTSLRYGNNRTAETPQYADGAFVAEWDSEHTTTYYNRASVNADSKDVTVTSYGAGSGKVGVYYNYCAASAGSYCYNSGAALEDTNASQDICPKGWRMPTGGSTGEYQALYTVYNSNATNFRSALSTPLSGLFSSGSASDRGTDGRLWSSTRNDGGSMYYLYVKSSSVNSQGSDGRGVGYSVRCLLQ